MVCHFYIYEYIVYINTSIFAYVFQDIVTKMLHVDPHQRLTAPQVPLPRDNKSEQ